jgi:hypothetical protein
LQLELRDRAPDGFASGGTSPRRSERGGAAVGMTARCRLYVPLGHHGPRLSTCLVEAGSV